MTLFRFKSAAADARLSPSTCWDRALHGMQPKTFAVIQRRYVGAREIVVAVIKGGQEALA